MSIALQMQLGRIMNENASAFQADCDVPGFCPNGSFAEFIERGSSALSESATDMVINGFMSVPYLTEAVIANQMGEYGAADTLSMLSESVFTSAWDTLKRWYNNAKKFIQGIIKKIKDNVALMTRNTDKWISTVKPMLDKKLDRDKQAFTYTGAPWAIKNATTFSIESKLSADPFMDAQKDAMDLVAALEEYQREKNADKLEALKTTLKGPASHLSNLKSTNEDLEIKKVLKAAYGEEDTPAFKKALVEEIKGKAASVDVKAFNQVSVEEMLKTIEGGKAFEEKLVKEYEKAEKSINPIVDKLNKMSGMVKDADLDKMKGDKDDAKAADRMADAKSEVSAILGKLIAINTEVLSMYNSGIACVKGLAAEQRKDYMRILTKYAKAAPVKA